MEKGHVVLAWKVNATMLVEAALAIVKKLWIVLG
jgi:hypothetical protein